MSRAALWESAEALRLAALASAPAARAGGPGSAAFALCGALLRETDAVARACSAHVAADAALDRLLETPAGPVGVALEAAWARALRRVEVTTRRAQMAPRRASDAIRFYTQAVAS